MDIEIKTLNYLKAVTAETISNAKSGHTGSALGASSILLALFHNHMHFDPTGLNWINRDRFVLSAGHASALLYNVMHLFGYDLTIDDLKNFRKYGSKTPGHPEYGVVPGVETTTGPLGQGVANAVGLAIAAAKMNALFPTLFNNFTYCYAGDGCLMEGVAMEACSLAGKLGLGKLILLYDDNGVTLDGAKDISNTENTAKKFEAMGWSTIVVSKGNDYFECTKAIGRAKSYTKPTIIIFKTKIGIGTSKEGTAGAHGFPLPAEELTSFKKSLEVEGSFNYPDDVYAFCHEATEINKSLIEDWGKLFDQEKDIFLHALKLDSFCDFKELLKKISENPEMAGRDVSKMVLNELSTEYFFLGGSADLASSTKARLGNGEDFANDKLHNNNIYFGVREHAMGSIANGIALYYKFCAFDSTFVSFSNYMIPSLRLRAMMKLPVLSLMTHDSMNIGEDGPTHQPIEQIPQMRNILGLTVIRPATYAEVVSGFKYFVTKREPVVLALTKSKISNLKYSTIDKADRGAYVIYETGENEPEIEIFASGTEVYLAIEVADALEGIGVRVISMPCEKLFSAQTDNFKSKILLENPKLKVAIEATDDPIWYKYIGEKGLFIGVQDYQCSGNGKEVYEKAGFNKDDIVAKIKEALEK